jgi:hypothetical protein
MLALSGSKSLLAWLGNLSGSLTSVFFPAGAAFAISC